MTLRPSFLAFLIIFGSLGTASADDWHDGGWHDGGWGVYCGPDLRQLAALIQAAKDSSPVLKLATRSCAPRT